MTCKAGVTRVTHMAHDTDGQVDYDLYYSAYGVEL